MPSSSNAIRRDNIIGVLLVHGSSEPCVLFVTCWYYSQIFLSWPLGAERQTCHVTLIVPHVMN